MGASFDDGEGEETFPDTDDVVVGGEQQETVDQRVRPKLDVHVQLSPSGRPRRTQQRDEPGRREPRVLDHHVCTP